MNKFKKLRVLIMALFLLIGAVLYLSGARGYVSASDIRHTCSCSGPIYCNGPCDTVWYEPNNCSCDAERCDFYDSCNTSFCKDNCPGRIDAHTGCCDNCFACSGTTCRGTCPDYINPCINVCNGGGSNGGSNGGGSTPSCTVDLTPDTASMGSGASETFTASVSDIQNGTVDRVDFVSSDTNIATVNPASDSDVVYNTEVTGVSLGSTDISAFVIMGGSNRCSDSSTVTVNDPGPWWQASNADLLAAGNIASTIPGTCSGGCNPVLILDGAGGYPGVAIYGGTLSTGTGTTSSTNWQVNAANSDKRTYNYAWFSRLIPSDVTLNEITSPSIPGSNLTTGGTQSDGFYWYHFDGSQYGDLTITSNVNIPSDRKVILLVEAGNLNIQGDINILSRGDGFFMTVAGQTDTGTKGDIFIDPSVGGPANGNPNLEGLFVAESEIRTGTQGADSDQQLHIRGSLASYSGIILERNLSDDSSTPAELFEYAPELLLLYPKSLKLEKMRWEEVAP